MIYGIDKVIYVYMVCKVILYGQKGGEIGGVLDFRLTAYGLPA
jgi:hypothetical protein